MLTNYIKFIERESRIIGFDSPIIPADSLVLDAGCGYRPFFSQRYETVAIDNNRECIEKAMKDAGCANCEYVIGLPGKNYLPFKDNLFDVVINSFIERANVVDWDKHLHEMLRVVKENGFSLIGTVSEKVDYLETLCIKENLDYERYERCLIKIIK